MKATKKLGIVGAMLGMLMALSAQATLVVNLATNGVGYVNPTFLGSSFTVTQLNNMITTYNSGSDSSPYYIYQGSSTPNPTLGLASALGSTTTGSGSPTGNFIDLGAGGYTYLSCQWDGPNGANAVYYIGGLSGTIELVNDLPGYYNGTHPRNQLGLSGYELSYAQTAIPEPSTVIAGALLLFPFGVSAFRILRRSRAT